MTIKFNETDLESYMRRCIELAKQSPMGIGRPYTGALVLSKNGEVVGEGYKTFVEPTKLVVHAERMALTYAGDLAEGGCLITTLEPCVRANKNQIFSPCSELIVESGIDTVVIAVLDNSPSVSRCHSMNFLRKRDINVIIYSGLNEIIEEELMPYMYRLNLFK